MTFEQELATERELQSLRSQLSACQQGLAAACSFFNSPGSFSHDEFRGIAEQVYEARDGKPCTYTGKVPYLDELVESQQQLAECQREREEAGNSYAALSRIHEDFSSRYADKVEQLQQRKERNEKLEALLIQDGYDEHDMYRCRICGRVGHNLNYGEYGSLEHAPDCAARALLSGKE